MAAIDLTPVAAHMIRAFDRGTKVICVWSGWGCGKTQGLIELAYYACHTRRAIDKKTGELRPASVLICAESIPKLEGSSLKVAREIFEGVRGARFTNKSGRPTWRFANGSQITFRGFEVYPNGKCSIEGEEHVLVIGDETQEMHEVWPRISRARARAENVSLATGKRYTGQTAWIGYPQANDRYLRAAKALQKKGKSVEFLHYRSSSNLWLPDDYEDERKADFSTIEEWQAVCQIIPGMTFPARDSYYGGVCRPAEYPEGNLISMPKVDRSIPTIVSLDPGKYSYSAVFWQFHEVEDQLKAVLVDAWAPTGTAVTDQSAIEEIRNRGFAIDHLVIDPFAGKQSGRQGHGRSTIELLSRAVDANPDGLAHSAAR